jgi:hypothetical protein
MCNINGTEVVGYKSLDVTRQLRLYDTEPTEEYHFP